VGIIAIVKLRCLAALGLLAVLLAACTPKPDPQEFTHVSLRIESTDTTTIAGVQRVIQQRLKAAGLNAKIVKDPMRIEVVGALLPEEVAALTRPGVLQFRKVLDANAGDCGPLETDPAKRITACDDAKSVHYQLDVAKVVTADVRSAKAEQTPDGTFVVLSFDGAGQQRWTELTREAFHNDGGVCAATSLGRQNHCLVAMVLDGVVISAPEILGVVTSDAYIAGGLGMPEAKALAWQIAGGELPAPVTVTEVANCASGRGCRRTYEAATPIPSSTSS
jgi:preprotein translocase subunit SecD